MVSSCYRSEWTGPETENDDDEDQCGAVLGPSYRKVEAKEPDERERKTRSTRCAQGEATR